MKQDVCARGVDSCLSLRTPAEYARWARRHLRRVLPSPKKKAFACGHPQLMSRGRSEILRESARLSQRSSPTPCRRNGWLGAPCGHRLWSVLVQLRRGSPVSRWRGGRSCGGGERVLTALPGGQQLELYKKGPLRPTVGVINSRLLSIGWRGNSCAGLRCLNVGFMPSEGNLLRALAGLFYLLRLTVCRVCSSLGALGISLRHRGPPPVRCVRG